MPEYDSPHNTSKGRCILKGIFRPAQHFSGSAYALNVPVNIPFCAMSGFELRQFETANLRR